VIKFLIVSTLVAGLNLATVVLARTQTPVDKQDQRPRYQVSVDMVSLSLTVFDEEHRLVTDLTQDEFKIYEDGVLQDIRIFSKEDLPLRMVILLDTSSSMRMKMEMAQEAAIEFVRSLKSEDQFKVIEFNSKVLTLVDFTTDLEQVESAIHGAVADGATALYNAIYISLQSLSRRRRTNERQAIVVLSDGDDTRSLVTFDDVVESARKTDVTIYTIFLRGTAKDLKKNKYFQAKYVLERLATESGGSAFSPENIKDLSGVYGEIGSEIKSQYNLGYISTNTEADGKWRRIQLICTRPGMDLRIRGGYYAPRPRRRRR
jgi:Ca-activated chloride channel family protein